MNHWEQFRAQNWNHPKVFTIGSMVYSIFWCCKELTKVNPLVGTANFPWGGGSVTLPGTNCHRVVLIGVKGRGVSNIIPCCIHNGHWIGLPQTLLQTEMRIRSRNQARSCFKLNRNLPCAVVVHLYTALFQMTDNVSFGDKRVKMLQNDRTILTRTGVTFHAISKRGQRDNNGEILLSLAVLILRKSPP